MKYEVVIKASVAPVVTLESALKIVEAILANDDVGIGDMVGYGAALFHCLVMRRDEGTMFAVFGNEAECLAAKDACTGEKMAFAAKQIGVDLS